MLGSVNFTVFVGGFSVSGEELPLLLSTRLPGK